VGGAADVFGPGGNAAAQLPAIDVKSLHAKIGALTLENDFLEGALGKAGLLSAMIDRDHDLAITKQAEALNISRGSVYYLPRPVSAANLAWRSAPYLRQAMRAALYSRVQTTQHSWW
jgi:putative transposase